MNNSWNKLNCSNLLFLKFYFDLYLLEYPQIIPPKFYIV